MIKITEQQDYDINDNFIKLPNNIYDDQSVSNEELTVLILLYRYYVQYKHLGISSIQILADHMMIDTISNKKSIKMLNEIIDELVIKGYIINLYDVCLNEITSDNPIKNKNMPFLFELIPAPEDNYFVINDMDIIHIFESLKGVNISKYNLIRYFIACRRVSNNTNNFGYLSQKKLKDLVNDSRTIGRYNKILQDDLHLIRYNNDYLTPDKHYCTTYIGHYNDEKNFNEQVKSDAEFKGLVHTNKIKSNVRRSVKQKINNISDSKNKELLEKQYENLQYKPSVKKDDVIKVVKHLGRAKPIVEDDEPDWDDIDEEDTSYIDINALLDEM